MRIIVLEVVEVAAFSIVCYQNNIGMQFLLRVYLRVVLLLLLVVFCFVVVVVVVVVTIIVFWCVVNLH